MGLFIWLGPKIRAILINELLHLLKHVIIVPPRPVVFEVDIIAAFPAAKPVLSASNSRVKCVEDVNSPQLLCFQVKA